MHPSVPTPPWNRLGKSIESKIRKALFDFQMLENTPHLAIALSGGKDSLTLLFMLKAIIGRGFPPCKLTAIHISGSFSCGASLGSKYLKYICECLDIPLIEVAIEQKQDSLECYSCSRNRRKLIFDAAKDINATTIAFGHHKDDNAQTILMNLLHKGEFAGILPKIPMLGYGITIIRPLIYVSERDISIFAKQNQFKRNCCQCPVGQNSMRKKVDRLIDEIEDLYPNARDNIASAGLIYGSKKAMTIKKEIPRFFK